MSEEYLEFQLRMQRTMVALDEEALAHAHKALRFSKRARVWWWFSTALMVVLGAVEFAYADQWWLGLFFVPLFLLNLKYALDAPETIRGWEKEIVKWQNRYDIDRFKTTLLEAGEVEEFGNYLFWKDET